MQNTRLPVPVKRQLPAKRAATTPALWRQAAPVVARGAALVAAGLIGEWLLRAAARNALRSPRPAPAKGRRSTAVVARPGDQLPEGIIAVTETLYMRRTILRR